MERELRPEEKLNLTIAEASAYTNIGQKKIRQLIKEPGCTFVLYVGGHSLIKRKRFEEYLDQTYVL